MENDTLLGDPCKEPNTPTQREFVMVAIIGTTIALICALENIVLFYVLTSREKFRTSHLFYLTFLAFFDIFIGLSYIGLMTVQILMEYLPSLVLTKAWHMYFRPVFTISHVMLTASSFLIVTATVERFLVAMRIDRYAFTSKSRSCAVLCALVLAVLLKGTIFFECIVVVNVNCTNRARYMASYSSLVDDYWFRTVWMFWFRNLFTVLIPFISLTYMNICIVRAVRRQTFELRCAEIPLLVIGKRLTDETRGIVRSATRMLVLVVSTYLMSKLPNFFLTVWEMIDKDSLFRRHTFYFTTVDIISILTVLVGAARLPIYCWCNKSIQEEVLGIGKSAFLPFKMLWNRLCRQNEMMTSPTVTELTPLAIHSKVTAIPSNSSVNGESFKLLFKTETFNARMIIDSEKAVFV